MNENWLSGLDEWKTRAPEDERGYWDGRNPECEEYYYDHQCGGCGDYESVCAACHLCETCHRAAMDVDPDEHRADLGLDDE